MCIEHTYRVLRGVYAIQLDPAGEGEYIQGRVSNEGEDGGPV